MLSYDLLDHLRSVDSRGRIENISHGLADLRPHPEVWSITLGILCEMKLTALPRDGGENRFAGRFQSRVIVADK